jgi:hypothetical protein
MMKSWPVKFFAMILFAGLSLSLLGACSQHERNFDASFDGNSILDDLDASISAASSGGGSSAQIDRFKALAAVKGGSLYYAEAGYTGAMGPVESIFSLTSLEFIKSTFSFADIEKGKIYFLDVPTAEGRKNALLIDLETFDKERVISFFYNFGDGFMDSSSVADEEFAAVMSNTAGDQSITIRSFDVTPGQEELQTVIQLKIAEIHDNEEVPIGKISTLVGFKK